MKTQSKLLFDSGCKDFILGIFDKTTDTEGFVVEKSNPKNRVLTPEGREITKEQLSIIAKGSQKFIAGDLTSLMKFSKREL